MLDGSLTWSDHIDGIVSKMGRGIALIRKCSAYLTPTVRNQVIQSLVFCHLQYCPIIWSAATKTELKKLQLVQNRAARLALNCSIRTIISYMHSCLSWLTVEVKLHFSLLMFFRNVKFKHVPQYFFEQLAYLTDIYDHHTRNASSGHLVQPTQSNHLMKYTVIYRAIKLWNALPPHISSKQNKLSFKKLLKAHLMPLTI